MQGLHPLRTPMLWPRAHLLGQAATGTEREAGLERPGEEGAFWKKAEAEPPLSHARNQRPLHTTLLLFRSPESLIVCTLHRRSHTCTARTSFPDAAVSGKHRHWGVGSCMVCAGPPGTQDAVLPEAGSEQPSAHGLRSSGAAHPLPPTQRRRPSPSLPEE